MSTRERGALDERQSSLPQPLPTVPPVGPKNCRAWLGEGEKRSCVVSGEGGGTTR